MMDVIVFDVEHGQSLFFYPRTHPEYGMFVDCGNTSDFEPVDAVIRWGWLPKDQVGRYLLSNLTLTNYDHDHFSGLPYLVSKAHIATIRFARNVSTQELKATKPVQTDALNRLCHLQDTYTAPAPNHIPPYTVATFSLSRQCFPKDECDTNNLSQIVFVSYGGSTICISGDVEAVGWSQLLQNPDFRNRLRVTNVFVAAHHGRENGYASEVFDHFAPECIIFSDKTVVHGTQEGMAQSYANHVAGNGIFLGNQGRSTARKVLTTRNDGHLWLRFLPDGKREYRNLI
jgi:beta-lactamase superfamily II metal-dependent hydrolase